MLAHDIPKIPGKVYYWLLVLFLNPIVSKTQEEGKCLTKNYQDHLRQQDTLYSYYEEFQNELANGVYDYKYQNLRESSKLISVPIVVHLIGDNVISKVGFTKINEQLRILNEDFGRIPSTNGYGNGVDTKFRFCLATKDAHGYATTGILAVSGNFANPWDPVAPYTQANSDRSLKALSHWSAKQFLNLYVVDDISQNALGYSSVPWDNYTGGTGPRDGVVIDVDYFGITSDNHFGLGRTATHEVGHWLGLYHTFERNANGKMEPACKNSSPTWNGDQIADTPPVAAPNNGCNLMANSCFESPDKNDLVENYMDYSDDNCFNMFTQGQADRMQTPLRDVSGFSSCLEQCNNGIADGDELGIDCGGSYCLPCGYNQSGGVYFCKNIRETLHNDDADDPWDIPNNCRQITFLINGRKPKTPINVCKDNILLTPFDYIKNIPVKWLFTALETSYLCSNTQNLSQVAKRTNVGVFNNKCHCLWLSQQIFIYEIDANLNQIGPIHSHEKFYYDSDQTTYNEYDMYVPLDINQHLPPGFQFQDGKYYAIRIRIKHPGYPNDLIYSSVGYIKTYGANLNLQNVTLTTSQTADFITIDDCSAQTTPIVNVVAKHSISITNSNLKSGRYFIDANLNCSNIHQYRSAAPSDIKTENPILISNTDSRAYMLTHQQSAVSKNASVSQLIFGSTSTINLYPNPASTNINLKIHSEHAVNIIIYISDLSQRNVFSQDVRIVEGTNEHALQIPNIATGLYQFRISDLTGQVVYNEKLSVLR